MSSSLYVRAIDSRTPGYKYGEQAELKQTLFTNKNSSEDNNDRYIQR